MWTMKSAAGKVVLIGAGYPRADEIGAALQARGIDVWRDWQDVVGARDGAAIFQAGEAAVGEGAALLLHLTERSDSFCDQEHLARSAARRGLPVCAFRMTDAAHRPQYLQELNAPIYDFLEPARLDEALLDQLASNLKAACAGQSQPPPASTIPAASPNPPPAGSVGPGFFAVVASIRRVRNKVVLAVLAFVAVFGVLGLAAQIGDRSANYTPVAATIIAVENGCSLVERGRRRTGQTGPIDCDEAEALLAGNPEYARWDLRRHQLARYEYASPVDGRIYEGRTERRRSDPAVLEPGTLIRVWAHKRDPAISQR